MSINEHRLEYVRCKQLILNYIGQNRLELGTALPSQRELCSMFGQSIITIRRALQELEQGGIVKAQAGKGVFVTRDMRYELYCGRILLLDLNAPERLLPPLELSIMREKINALGYSFEMISCGDRPTPFVCEKINSSTGILATGIINESWKTLLTSLSVPVVIIGGNNGKINGLKTVDGNLPESVTMAFDYFKNKSLKRVGFLNASPDYVWTKFYYEVFNGELAKHGMSADMNPIVNIRVASMYEDTCAFLQKYATVLDGLIVEIGILPFLLQIYYIHSQIRKLPIAVIGSSIKNVFDFSDMIIQFCPEKSIFQFSLDVLIDSFNKPEQQKYKGEIIETEIILINEPERKGI